VNHMRRAPLRARAEAWLWTGPVGHLLGGGLDLAGAIFGYLIAKVRDRAPG
jgi:hypothetical protein